MKITVNKQELADITTEDNRTKVLATKDINGKLQVLVMAPDELRTYEQIKCIKSLCSYFQKAKLKDMWLADDYLDEFKRRADMIQYYCIMFDSKFLRLVEEPKGVEWYPMYKSCSNATKKELNIVIDRIVAYTKANLEVGNFGSYSDKIFTILEKLRENSDKKIKEYKDKTQKEIEKQFKGVMK